MKQTKLLKTNERGSTLVEFALAAAVLLTAVFGVIEFGRALWVHNALSDAARRGARYASLHTEDSVAEVKNVVVYGNPAGSGKAIAPNLTAANVTVTYTDFALNHGTVTVSVENYQFQFVVPIVGTTITMPKYSTTLPGECIGYIPDDI